MEPKTFCYVWWIFWKTENRSWNPFMEELDSLFGIFTQIYLVDKHRLNAKPERCGMYISVKIQPVMWSSGYLCTWSVCIQLQWTLLPSQTDTWLSSRTYSEYMDTLSPLNIFPCFPSPSLSFLINTESAVNSTDWVEVVLSSSLSPLKVDLESLKSSLGFDIVFKCQSGTQKLLRSSSWLAMFYLATTPIIIQRVQYS